MTAVTTSFFGPLCVLQVQYFATAVVATLVASAVLAEAAAKNKNIKETAKDVEARGGILGSGLVLGDVGGGYGAGVGPGFVGTGLLGTGLGGDEITGINNGGAGLPEVGLGVVGTDDGVAGFGGLHDASYGGAVLAGVVPDAVGSGVGEVGLGGVGLTGPSYVEAGPTGASLGGAGLGGVGLGGTGLEGAGLDGPALIAPGVAGTGAVGSGVVEKQGFVGTGGFQSSYGSSAGVQQAGYQGTASGHNQESGSFASGDSQSRENAYSNKQGYSHSSGFSASEIKAFGSGHKQGSSGLNTEASGHLAGFGQTSYGKAVGVGGVGLHG